MSKQVLVAVGSAVLFVFASGNASAQTYTQDFNSLTPQPGSNPNADYGGIAGTLPSFSVGSLITGSWTEIESVPPAASSSVRVLGAGGTDKFLDMNVGLEAMRVNLQFLTSVPSVTFTFQATGTAATPVPNNTLASAFTTTFAGGPSSINVSSGPVILGDSDLAAVGLSNPTFGAANGGSKFTYTFSNVAAGAYTFTMARAASSSGAFGMDDFTITAVPEPGTYAMMLAGLASTLLIAKRRARKLD